MGDPERVRTWSLPLYGKVCLINGVVFVVGTLVFALSPASISSRVLVSEVVVLTLGLGIMLVTNAVLLRGVLRPLDRVIRQMEVLDLGERTERLPDDVDDPDGPGGQLVRTYNAMIDRLEVERAASNSKALAAQEAERHRIAQDLHDEVGQSLTVVLLGLKQLEARAPEELHDDLTLLRESARAGLDDVRRVARQLRPDVLADLGLHSALAALTTEFSAHGRATVRRSVAPGLPVLPAEAELVVYRVAQEALTNVARHAGATTVELSLTRLGDSVVLEVADDGRGLGPSGAAVPGSGLLGMEERARLVGGDVAVASAPGGGTRVRLRVPLTTSPSGSSATSPGSP